MPLPEQIQIQVPNFLNAYLQGQQIRQGREQNALLKMKTAADMKQTEQKANLEKAQTLSTLLGAVTDAQTYNLARAQALRLYPDLEAQIPEQYDPAKVDYWKKAFIPLRDQLGMKGGAYTDPIDPYNGPAVFSHDARQFEYPGQAPQGGGTATTAPQMTPGMPPPNTRELLRADEKMLGWALQNGKAPIQIKLLVPNARQDTDGHWMVGPPAGSMQPGQQDMAARPDSAPGIVEEGRPGQSWSTHNFHPNDPRSVVNPQTGAVDYGAINRFMPGAPRQKQYRADAEAYAAQIHGQMKLERGRRGTEALTEGAKSEAQKQLMAPNEEFRRLLDLEGKLDADYLRILPKIGSSWSALKDKLGLDLAPEEEDFLIKYSQFKQGAIENINAYIKRIRGAQMSEAEAGRIRQAMPDPGEGWFDGDSPKQFKAKLSNALMKFRSARARYAYYLNRGLAGPEIEEMIISGRAYPLSEMRTVMRNRERQIRAGMPGWGLTEEQADAAVRMQMAREFGLGG